MSEQPSRHHDSLADAVADADGLPESVASLAQLVGIAHAIEAEAVRRYEMLAREMDRLGATETATTFRNLLDEEREHIDAVAAWAERLHEPVPPAAWFAWRLPKDLMSSWDEIEGNPLLTPYRALAIAVMNEERAYAYYKYISAHAGDRRIAAAAEEMAQEELKHATYLRKLRRRAFHDERMADSAPVSRKAETLSEFHSMVRHLQREAARDHAEIAARLARMGDGASAALLAVMSKEEAITGGLAIDVASGSGLSRSVELLYRAQAPLESLADACEAILAHTHSEELKAAAQSMLSETIARMAEVSLRLERLE